MREIKTRDAIRDVKALDRAATAAERMKDAFVRTKDSAERTQVSEYDSPSGYAIDKIKGKAEDTAREAAHQAGDMGGKALHKARDMRRSRKEVKRAADSVRDSVDGVRESARGAGKAAKGAHQSATGVGNAVRDTSHSARTAADLPKELMKKRAHDAARRSGTRVLQSADNTVKTVQQSEKCVRSTAKGAVRTTRKSIKTAEQTAKTTVKTTQRAAQAARKTAQVAAEAAKRSARAARAAARATARAVKITVKATISAVKAIIAVTKALVTAIAAGGWVVVAVILIICMVALLICSVFGIFFSSESGVSENGVTMQSVVSQINTEFAGELARIQRENPHDSCEITANRALWKDILAVYAVRTNTDPDNPLDVITLDDEKIELLRTVFWDMNIIDYWIETIEHTSTDADGTTETWYEYILHITVTGKTASEMAEQYGFNAEQMELLEELLRPEYDELWTSLLAGVPSGGGTGTISLGMYIWPSVDSNYVTSFFGTRVHPISGEVHHHNGIDIGAAYGTEVLAAADGTVTLAGWNGGYGYCVIIDHGDGNRTLYAHMSQLSVSAGQTVTQGQTVGFVGSTGISTGAHLHFVRP